MNEDADCGSPANFPSLEDLGLDGAELDLLQAKMAEPTGLVLVGGVTGSRHEDTINACVLHAMTTFARKVALVTHDDLYDQDDSPAPPSGGRLSKALAEAMRSDPDLIITHETRSVLGAEFAIKCALSGYKLITSIHGGSSFKIVDRMLRFGVSADDLKAPHTLSALVYQVSLPRLCPHCSVGFADTVARSPDSWDKGQIRRLEHFIEPGLLGQLRFRSEAGCSQCHRGVIGMTLAVEVVSPDSHLLDLIVRSEESSALDYFREKGGRTVFDSAISKAFRGEIDLRAVEAKLGPLAHYIVCDEDCVRFQYEYPPEYLIEGATAVPVIRDRR